MAVAPPTRVAVVQLAYHPAAVVHQRSPLCDPLFDPARPTSSLEPRAGVRLSEALQGDLRGLGERVRRAHGAQIAGKVAAILGACRGWGVDLVVFPEYSLACELLPAIAAAAGDMIVVAGTHAVDQAALAGDVYRALACPEDQRPRLGEAVCPVLFRGELLALQPKLHAAPPERGSLRLGDRWRPIDLPEETGVPGPLGALVCLDFLVRESDAHRRLVAPHLEGSTLLAVPSLTPDFTLPEFAAKLREEARRYKRPVAYANLAREGGTTVAADDTIGAPFPFGAGELPAGDEGVIVVDVDLRPGRRGRSRAYAEAPIVTPFAEASLVYRTHPHGDAFAAWIETLHQAIAALPADDDGSALVELLGTVDERRQFLLDAGAIPGASARGRRIAALLDRLGSIHSAEELARYTREVIVPPEILPFEHVREAMALGAHEEVHGWVTAPERDVGVEVMEIAHRLKAGGKPMRMPQEGMWTEAGRRGIEAVRRAVAGERPAESGANAPSMPTHSSADEASPPGGPPPESRDFEIDGLHVHLRRDGREVHEFQRARSRDGIWPEIQILEADELRAWLVDEGVTDVRLVGVTDAQGRRRSGLYVLGRRPDKGDFRLWRVATAEPVMTGKRLRLLLTRLGIEVPGAEGRHLDVLRARLSGLVDRLRDRVLDDLGARRAEKLDDVEQHYEPPDVTIGGSGAPTPALGALDAWIDDDAGSTALLLGEFGAGKSTLLTEWAQRRWKAGAGRLPVLVPLLEARVDEAPTQLLLRALGREDTEVECARLSLLLRHRRLVPCFDGVDEVATRIDESALRARLRVLSDCTGPMGQVLISARDHTFGSDGELARALPGARRFTLAPLSEDKVSHLIGEIRGADADAILRRLAGTYDLADLVRRPLLLGMVLKSLDELDPAARVGTADVYNAYIAHWLRQSHVGAAEALGDDAKIVYAEELAAELWRSGAPSCSIQQLRARVLEVLRDQLIEDGAIDSVSAYYEIQTGAFFVRESDNSFRFAHRSFLEFFLARGLVRHLESEPGRRLATRPLTREVLLFVDQLLRREYGDPLESPPIQGVRRWLVSGAEEYDHSREIDPRVTALRMLLHLPMLARHAEADTHHDTRQWVPEGARLAGIRLPGEDLRHAQLARVELTRAGLNGADLTHSNLAGSKLSHARLSGARLSKANLSEVLADGADFARCEADGADLRGALLTGATLSRSTWTDCTWTHAEFEGATTKWTLMLPPVVHSHCEFVELALATHWIQDDSGYPEPPESQIAWSPCGRYILVVTYDGIPGHEFVHSIFDLYSCSTSIAIESLRQSEAVEFHAQPHAVQLLTGPRPPFDYQRFAWSPSGSAVAWTTTDNDIVVYYPASQTYKITWTFGTPQDHPLAMSWLPDEESLLVLTRDALRQQVISAAKGHVSEIANQLSFTDGDVRIFEREGRTLLVSMCRDESPSERVTHLDFFHVDLVGLHKAGTFICPAPTTAEDQHDLRYLIPPWRRIDISPDGQTAVIVLRGHLYIYSIATDTILYSEHNDDLRYATRVAWSPRSDHVAIAGLTTWIMGPFTGSHDFRSDESSVDLEWSPDGSMLATALENGRVIIRNAADLAPRLILHHTRSTQALCTPGGFFSLVDADSHEYRARVRDGDTDAFVPLGGLRRVLHRPDRVQAALRGDLSQDDIRPALREAGLLDDDVDPDVSAAEEASSPPSEAEKAAERLEPDPSGSEVGRGFDLDPLVDPDVDADVEAEAEAFAAPFESAEAPALETAAMGPARRAPTPDEAPVAPVTTRSADPAGTPILLAETNDEVDDEDGLRSVDAFDGDALTTEVTSEVPSTTPRPETPRVLTSPGARAGASAVTSAPTRPTTSPARPGGVEPTSALASTDAHAPTGAHAQASSPPVPSDRSKKGPRGRSFAAEDDAAGEVEPPDDPNKAPATTSTLTSLLRKLAPSKPSSEAQRRLREKIAERPPVAPNPFLPGRPLNDADALPGREDVLSELLTLIDQRSPALLKGPRRAGKSSILYTLARVEGGRRPVVHRTLEGRAPRTPADFACLLDPALKDRSDPAEALVADLEAAPIAPLFLLDEVAWLTRADEGLFPWLRVLGQTGLCALLVAGTHSDWIDVIRVANRTPGSSFGNDYTIVELPALAERDAIAFLVDTAPDDVTIDPDRGARWIVELCGGWPFYLQVMGYAVVEEARQGKRTPLVDKGALFDLYERRLLRDRVAVFRSRWADLRPLAQGVMLRILEAATRSRSGLALPSYRDLARRERAILGDAGLVDGQRGWLLDPPFRDWLLRNFDELEAGEDGDAS